MSIHPSLAETKKGKKFRTVLKRYERIQHMQQRDKWTEHGSVYNLPKIKNIKIKIKKTKTKEATATTAAAGAAQPAAAAPAAAAAKSADKGAGKK